MMMMTFKSKITKEEINQLDTIEFQGEIILIDETTKINKAIDYISSQPIVGIDTETRPSFTKGTYFKVSLMQIATQEKCFLFRLNKIGFPPEIPYFISNNNVKKIGLSLRDDFYSLNKRKKINPSNVIDIQNIVQDYGILELSLQKIYAILFNKKISKAQRLTNWENETLTPSQQRYAATDAWACLRIYQQLLVERKISKNELKTLISETNQPVSYK